jgi:ATP-dependent helicase/nuclease subunit B
MTGHAFRTFLGWDGPALPAAARWLADHHATGDALDLGGVVVVLPGARAGRRLKELLVEESRRLSARLVPPRVVTIGELPELLYEPSLPLAEEAHCRLAWARALRGAGDGLRGVFADSPASDDLRGWLRLAAVVHRLHRETGAGALRFEDVARICAEGDGYDDAQRWRVLARVQVAYVRALAAAGREDRELARMAALDRGSTAAPGAVRIAGVTEMPAVVRRMLERLEDVHALVHAPVERADGFDALGCVVAPAWREAEIEIPDAQLEVVSRPAAQAAALVRALARLDGRYSAEEIVVGVPDPEVVPYVQQRLEAVGLPARFAAGAAVERTAPFRLLEAVAEYLDGRAAASVAALARHPDAGNWLLRAAARLDAPGAAVLRAPDAVLGTLDAYLSDHLPARLAGRLPAIAGRGRDQGNRDGVAALVRALDRLTGELRGERRLAEWAPRMLELLLSVYGHRTLDRSHPRERHLLQACRRLRDAAASLYRLPAAADESCGAATALRVLLDQAGGAAIPPDPDAAAIELLGWLELPLDDAPVAILTGANEPFLPESVSADAFLPNALRTRLGLLDNDGRFARDAHHLLALLHSREQVHIIAGRRSATGDPLRPSRLLLRLRAQALATRITRFLDDGEAERRAAPQAGGAPLHAGGRRPAAGFTLPPEPVLQAAEPFEVLPVTAFRALLRDPYLYALGRERKLESVSDDARELDPLRFGSLAHDVLEAFGRSAEANSADEPDVARRLAELLEEAARERFGNRLAQPAVRVQVAQLDARLRRFAACHAEWIAQGWRVVGVECRTEVGGGVPFPAHDPLVRLTGRIDRIDHNPHTGEWAVFDYKTGDQPTTPEKAHCSGRGENRRWTDLQLPLYRHILPHVRDPDGNVVYTGDDPDAVLLGYVVLCRDADAIRMCTADWSADDLRQADAAAGAVAADVNANHFEFVPDMAARAPREYAALLGAGRLVALQDADAADDEEEVATDA